jgi:hypothetical protein
MDLSLGNVITMTLTGNVTSSTWANAVASVGQEITFIITQNGTGGYTFVWPTAIVPAGIAPCPNLAPNSVSIFKGIVDGSGNVNFVANGPVTVFRKVVTGINAATGYVTFYTLPAVGNYRATASLYVTTTSASGATFRLQLVGANGNTAYTSSNAGTAQLLYPSYAQAVIAISLPTYDVGGSGQIFGYQVYLNSGTPTTEFIALQLVVEYLGN